MNARDITILALSSALLGGAIVRVVSPGPAATRQISVEAVEIQSAPIKSGESLVQESTWAPPDDVFIVGWAPDPGAPPAAPELYLLAGSTTIFLTKHGADGGLNPVLFPSGTGFMVRKGESVKLRLQMTNSGADGETKGARALIYFHPVAWR